MRAWPFLLATRFKFTLCPPYSRYSDCGEDNRPDESPHAGAPLRAKGKQTRLFAMKATLAIGITGQQSIQISPRQTITLGGNEEATVFSTPSMVNLMEYAARETLCPHLESHEESVGIDVHIEHTSATPPGNKVTAIATVTGVQKNVIEFDVVATDAWGEIGRGKHRRAVIRTAKFAERLAEQKPSLAAPVKKAEVGDSATSLPRNLSTVQLATDKGVLRVTLQRPEKLNAMSRTSTEELESVCDYLAQNPNVRVVVIQGAGGNFCVGDDVTDLSSDIDESVRLSRRRGELYSRMVDLPQIIVGALQGQVLGGGFVLAAACDIRIATHGTQLGLPEVNLGWPPNYGLGIVQSVLGRSRTMELALSGKPISARRALEIGFVGQVTPEDRLDTKIRELVDALLKKPSMGLSYTKQLMSPNRGWCDERASDAFGECLQSVEAQRNIDRFRKK